MLKTRGDIFAGGATGWRRRRTCAQSLPASLSARKTCPDFAFGNLQRDPQLLHLPGVEQQRMILRMADGWQHPAFLRVGENDRRPGPRVGFGKGVAQLGKIVAAEVAKQVLQFRIVPLRPAGRTFPAGSGSCAAAIRAVVPARAAAGADTPRWSIRQCTRAAARRAAVETRPAIACRISPR